MDSSRHTKNRVCDKKKLISFITENEVFVLVLVTYLSNYVKISVD